MNHQFTTALPSCLGQVSFLDLSPVTRRRQPEAGRRPAYSFDTPSIVNPCSLATDTLRFVLRQSAQEASYLHLTLFCRERQLAHWILPASSLTQSQSMPSAYLVEATGTLPLPAQIIDEGTCLLRKCPADQARHLEKELRAGHLQLTFAGRSLRGAFSLDRLHTGSHTWELGRMRVRPARLAQALA
ncbi:hypothetical protein [Hymenobacter cellulosilyticus]|uniref:Uncharacterized protein n=1 Tax=Hymenobacter cellulosilyticus TaxID=2932248 RepID=A0A8T9Q5R7_9BACT|nr:hypothetical protein [Hymenobacter cellulosilyticus]UOQ71308.1 hypothetical protein MUN79_22150 [Hymenobacter cellulosilyticus]